MGGKELIKLRSNDYDITCHIWQRIEACIKGKEFVINGLVNSNGLVSPNYGNTINGHFDSQLMDIYVNNINSQITQKKVDYWRRAVLFNATARTHESLKGMIFSKPYELEVPSKLDYIKVNELSRQVVSNLVSKGRCGVLVDDYSSDLKGNIQESEVYKPYHIFYKPEQILYCNENASGNLINVLLVDEVISEKGEAKERYTYLSLDNRVYTIRQFSDSGKLIAESQPKINGSFLNEIPFVIFGVEANNSTIDKPTLQDLTDVNLGHFVLDADNRENLHYNAQGSIFLEVNETFDSEEHIKNNAHGMRIGAGSVNIINGTVKLLQLDASGAIPNQMSLEEQKMIMLGAQVVQDVNSNATLGAKEMEFSASTSQLKNIAYNASVGIEKALSYLAMFNSVNSKISFKLNTQFVTDDMTPQLIQQHIALVQSGYLPDETIYTTARRAGFTELSDEEIKNKIDSVSVDATSSESAEKDAKIAELEARLKELES